MKTHFGRLPALVAILLGIALRLWQYVANPSLWVDEAAVARNVLDRDVAHLFGGLDYGQVAPPGFLLGVKLSAALCGGSEYVLRLIPLLAGVAGPALFYFVARAALRPLGTIVATFLFSLAVPLIFFSSNLKQYSSDVAVTLLVIGIALRIARSTLTRRGACGYALLSGLLLFVSQAAVFATTAAGAVLLVDALASRGTDGRTDRRLRLALVAFWGAAVSASVLYARSILSPVDEAYLHRFWAPGFLPRAGAFAWLWTTARNAFGVPPNPTAFDGSLHLAWPALFVLLFVFGCVGLARRDALLGSLVGGPIALILLASAAHAYPFNARLCLFLLPLFLLAFVAGAEQVGDLLRWQPARYAPLCLLPFAVWAFVQQPPPWTPEHLRPVMQQIAARWQPGDALWVYYGAGQAYAYYSQSIPLAGNVRVATCDRADPRELLRQVDLERGRARVWILMAHGSGPFGFDERGILLDYLETVGRRLDRFHAPAGDTTRNRAEAALFDLSDPERLARTTAERFPIGNVPPSQTWTCYGTMSPQGSTNEVEAAVLDGNRP
ncbi:MAG TPA: hypothetical protein VGS22_05575 [Thermoanaerobaculia bacterium]|jgi:hypothetical protein|nr:hypothetical protein [Thermoanaerobaculia bacterium]